MNTEESFLALQFKMLILNLKKKKKWTEYQISSGKKKQ